jgi:hypothetical protein
VEGRVLVTDKQAAMCWYTITGNSGAHLGKNGKQIGDFWLPAGIFIDDRNMIYVADQMNRRVQEFQYINDFCGHSHDICASLRASF